MWARRASSPLILLSCYAGFTLCAPADYFPINSQLPPVARIAEPFSFVFSPSTFESPYSISYSLVDSPEWLSIDSSGRRLYGTPQEGDVAPGAIVGVPISIAAEDEQGSTTVNSTLVVSRNPAPKVVVPLSEQLPSFGQLYSAPSSVILNPLENFSFQFDTNTFDQSGLTYYAVSGDNAPLPSWISFDPNSISFTGRTPATESLVQPPTTFDVKLVASDVVGFASVSVPFSIVVGNHELTAETTDIVANASIGDQFQYDDLSNILRLDGEPLDRSNVTSISAAPLPEWLQFDSETWILDGTPGAGAAPVNVTISIVDIYSDVLNISLAINIATELFRSDLPFLNASAGTNLALDLKPYILDTSDTELQLADQSQAPWIRYNSADMELTGAIPDSETAFEVQIALKASSRTADLTESRELSIKVAGSQSKSQSTGPVSSSTDATQKPSSTAIPPPKNTSDSASRTTKIVLGILVPLIVICIIALILLLCCYRRRQRDQEREHIPEVSAPIPGSFVKHNTGSFDGGTLQNLFDLEIARRSHSDSFTTAPVIPFRFRNSSNSSFRGSEGRRSTTFYAFGGRSLSDSAVRETRESWLADRAAPKHASPSTVTNDEASMFTDATPGSVRGATPALVISGPGPHSYRRSLMTSPVPGLSVPTVHEPSSIQATPEFAYITAGSDSDGSSRSKSPTYPDSAYSGVPGLGIQRSITSVSRPASTRMSEAWKKASPSRLLEEYKRKSDHSISTIYTTRTSILTEAVDPIQRPTVVHVPNRGQSRQISRRVDDSSALFGGGAIVRSPKNFGMIAAPSPQPSQEQLFTLPAPVPHERNYSWNRAFAPRSLGIAQRDFYKPSSQPVTARTSRTSVIFSPYIEDQENRELLPFDAKQSDDLMSLDRWPIPNSASNSDSSSRTTLKLSSFDTQDVSPQEKLHNKEKQAAEDFRRLISEPDRPWPLATPTRPLPKTPTKLTRTPFADRPNESTSGGTLGPRSNFSRKSNKSVKTIVSDYAGTEDGWEDIRPDSVLDGNNLFKSSTGSGPAFI